MGNVPVRISFNASDTEECKRVVAQLQVLFAALHGPIEGRDIFVSTVKSKRHMQEAGNLKLVIDYLRSGLSVKKFAKKLAEKNKALSWSKRYGTGSTIPEAIEKHIGRLKKDMTKRGVYHGLVTFVDGGTIRNKMSADILK